MKCPYCGAEVVPNTKCEYCDSFVEREPSEGNPKNEYQQLEDIIIETAEHFGDALQGTAEHFGDALQGTAKELGNTFEKAATPENKRFLKNLIIIISVTIAVIALGFFLFLFISLRSAFTSINEIYSDDTKDSFYSTNESVTEMYDISSLTDETATVVHLDSDGSLTLNYEGDEYSTQLLDHTLLDWLNKHDHSLDGVGVLFTTDSDGNVISLAMSSHTFYVLQQQDDTYWVLRQGDVFCTTSDVALEVGSYYDGYFNYPDLNAHAVTSNNGDGYSLFDPVCDAKEMQTFSDPYTGEEFSLPMIYTEDAWYHCSQELYDACDEGQVIPSDIRIDKTMGIIYIAE